MAYKVEAEALLIFSGSQSSAYIEKIMTKSISVPDEIIINKIYIIRGQKVMVDRDLAEMYGVEPGC